MNEVGTTLNDATEQYCLAAFNNKKAWFANFLYHAQTAWRELFLKTLYSIVQTVVQVHIAEDGRPYIKKPKDCSRILGVAVHDTVGYHPLLLSGQVLADIDFEDTSKKCATCSSGQSLCSIEETKIVTRTEKFNGEDVVLKTWYQTLGSGEVIEVSEYPVWDEELNKVVIEEKKNNVCSLELNTCGCVKNTEANKVKMRDHCGRSYDRADERFLIQNEYGYFNHNFDSNRIYLLAADAVVSRHGNKPLPKELVLTYQSSGTHPNGEIMVPDYAIATLHFGITFYAGAHRQNVGRLSTRDNKVLWDDAKVDLFKFLNPIDMDHFVQLQEIIPLW